MKFMLGIVTLAVFFPYWVFLTAERWSGLDLPATVAFTFVCGSLFLDGVKWMLQGVAGE